MVALYCLGFTVTKVGYDMKYQTVAYPLFILLFINIMDLPGNNQKFYIRVSFLLYFPILLVEKYVHPVKTYDYKSVANFLQSNGKNDEPIFMYQCLFSPYL